MGTGAILDRRFLFLTLEYFPLLESRESLEETKRYFQIAR